MKGRLIAALLISVNTGIATNVSANGDLTDLITELEHIKHMVVLQQQAANNSGQRIVFRYDRVELRIDALITDIRKHIQIAGAQPRTQLIKP
jgi:RAQPRD family integrative conjugative element protein